jgi:hypothetical protein
VDILVISYEVVSLTYKYRNSVMHKVAFSEGGILPFVQLPKLPSSSHSCKAKGMLVIVYHIARNEI